MNAIDSMIQAQDRILQTLSLCEKTIGELYELYEKCIPEMADFWHKIAAEEQTHAIILDRVRSDLNEGELMRGLGHFSVEQVQDRIDYVNEQITEARENPPTRERAVSIALSIESSIIDSRFFEFAQSNGSEFQKAAHQLKHDTQDHIEMVREAKRALEQAENN